MEQEITKNYNISSYITIRCSHQFLSHFQADINVRKPPLSISLGRPFSVVSNGSRWLRVSKPEFGAKYLTKMGNMA